MSAQLSENEGATRSKETPRSALLTLLDLPSEIIDKICDAIDSTGYACSLSCTCSRLRYPAQRQVFKRIRILNREQVNCLNTCFDSNPLLPNMTRDLILNNIVDLPSHKGLGAVAAAIRKICPFLDKLSCLRSFTLGHLPRITSAWGDTPKEFQVALRNLFRRCKNLEEITLQNLRQIPPNLFDDCAGLRKLAVFYRIDDPPVEKSAVFAKTVHCLDTLKITAGGGWAWDGDGDTTEMGPPIRRNYPILAYCTSQNGLDLTKLQSLEIVLDSCSADLSGVLSVCASSLMHLTISASHSNDTNSTINLSMLTSLQTFYLNIRELPFRLYPQYVSALAPPPSLHSIAIGTQLGEESHTARAFDHLPSLVSSLHTLHARSLSAHGNLQIIQLFIPIYKRERLPQRAERYLVWPDQETEGVFEVHWREKVGGKEYLTVTKNHRADAAGPNE